MFAEYPNFFIHYDGRWKVMTIDELWHLLKLLLYWKILLTSFSYVLIFAFITPD